MADYTKEELLRHVAPCALLCYTCSAYRDGAIARCANELCGYFEGYYEFNEANLPEKYRGWLDNFKIFYDRLAKYGDRPCPSCRESEGTGAGCVPGCVVPACVKERGLDFCAECSDFPCEKARAIHALGDSWEANNQRLREIGVEKYFEEKKNVPHYIAYKRAK